MRPKHLVLLLLFCSCEEEQPVEQPRFNKPLIVIKKSVEVKQDTSGVVVVSATEAKPISKPIVANNEKQIQVTATAYCPCARCCGRMTGRTSTGSNAWKPGIAVDPRAIPYGTEIKVSGYDRAEWAIADDTGGAVRRAWRRYGRIELDMRMTYHWQAVNWGRQTLMVTIRQPSDMKEEQR